MNPDSNHDSILIVEDDDAAAELERRVLIRSGLRVRIATCVKDALAALAAESYSAVLLDYNLLDGDPWLVVDAANSKSPRIPVIVVTAQGNERIASEALRRGVADYMKKTESFWDQLPDALDRVRRLARTEEALAEKTRELMRSNAEIEKLTHELKVSEERLRRFYDTTPALMYSVDKNGKVLTISNALLSKLGYACDEIVGHSTLEFLTPASREFAINVVLPKFFQTGRNEKIEYQVVAKDGSIIDVLLSGYLERDADGNAAYSLQVLEDVTGRRILERRLTQKHERLTHIVESTYAGTYEWNVQTGETIFNERWAEIIGQTLKSLQPISLQTWLENTHPDDLIRSGELLERHFSNQSERYRCEVRMRHRDGHWVWVLSRGRVMTWTSDGKPEWMFGTHEDITRRVTEQSDLRAANVELAATTNLQQAILNSANFSIIATDVDGIVKIFSSGAERMLGYTSKEFVDVLSPAILHDPSEIAARAEALSTELGRQIPPNFETFVAKARCGAPDEAERTYIRKDGSRLPVMLSVTSVRNKNGDLTGFLGIAYDLTDRKKTEQMKNEFISTVSHELRTPLTSIRGSLGLVVAGAVGEIPPRAKSLLAIANSNCERLVRLINDILDVEKIESGNMRFDTVTQRVLPLVEQAIQSTQSYAAQHGVKFVLQTGGEDAYVMVDADRMTQVMVNLLSNAAKFSPSSAEVKVKLECKNGKVRMSVIDEGKGISDEFKTRIFQKFAQADSSDTRQKGGTGLGLSISKAIVEKHHGHIGFNSTIGEGSEFYFELPVLAPTEY